MKIYYSSRRTPQLATSNSQIKPCRSSGRAFKTLAKASARFNPAIKAAKFGCAEQ